MNSIDMDIILHPHRFAVAAALSKGDATVDQLKIRLPHISQASLYRAIKRLEQSSLITRVNERKTRGTVEVTYSLGFSLSQMTMPEDADLDHYKKGAYAVFFQYVLGTLESYKQNEIEQLKKAKFNAVSLTLNDEQYQMFVNDVRNLISTYMQNGQDRQDNSGTPYELTTFLVPGRNEN